MPRSGSTAVLGLVALLVLTGCTAGQDPSSLPLKTYQGTAISQKTASSSDEHPTVYWIVGRHDVALSAYGSSGCPMVPASVQVVSSTQITVPMRDYGDRACSADLTATTSEFAIPASVSRSTTVHVRLDAKGFAPTMLELRPDPAVASRAR